MRWASHSCHRADLHPPVISRLLKLALLLIAALTCGAIAIGAGVLGRHEGPGVITGSQVPTSVIKERAARQSSTRAALAIDAPKDILFGDFHTHTTLSMDAFMTSLPFAVGEGSHPQADACDFARYCSALDFWSINDHAEFLTPRRWRETVDSIRDCNARAGDPTNPDVVAFLGWEWTNIGTDVNNHWGHKNVVLRDLEDNNIPTRAIQSSPTRATDLLETLNFAARTAMALMFLGEQRVQDFAKYAFEGELYDACPDDVHVKDLPADCRERAATPEVLLRKLREWDVKTLVIPHGNTWGIYTPPGADWDKQLTESQHDPQLQTLFEVYSGHGNTEEYRGWRSVAVDASGKRFCPAPTSDFTPVCWRAGEIIEARCLAEGAPQDDCAERAAVARDNYLAAPTLQGEATVPLARGQDWLDAGQCRDCFQPAWYYRPGGSAQYALALTNFADPGNPLRFRFGFIGSSDVHTARPGTGYKEYDRFYMADFQLPPGNESTDLVALAPPARSIPWEQVPEPSMFSDDGLVDDRVGAFYQTGGLVATHSAGRDRGSIWEALERREVYATSGQRTLLWFDLLNVPDNEAVVPMGAEVAMTDNPRFRVRAAGSFKQQPGCPAHATRGLTPQRLERLCRGECYNPAEERKLITRIEVVRIRPQSFPGEPVDTLIEDPWRSFDCGPDPLGCTVEFLDDEFAVSARDALYYVRAIEEPGLAVNGALLDCKYDGAGKCSSINPTPESKADDRLAPIEERAWSSPIFVNYGKRPGVDVPE